MNGNISTLAACFCWDVCAYAEVTTAVFIYAVSEVDSYNQLKYCAYR